MKVSENNSPFIWRKAISQTLIIIASIVIIVASLPRHDDQAFKYEVDMPWMYSTFTASFDFPIYKDTAVFNQECRDALATFQPYFHIDPNVEKRQVAKIEADYKDGLPGLPAEYLRIVTNRLHRVYQAGVMSAQDYNEIVKDSSTMVRIIAGKTTESRYVSHFYSTRTAYNQLFVDDELGEMRQTLQRCNLNEYIEPNVIYDKERTEDECASMLAHIPPTKGMVKKDQKIIDRGELVDESTAAIISSYEREKKRRSTDTRDVLLKLLGQTLIVSLVISLYSLYLFLFRRDYFEKIRSMMMLYLLITVFVVLVSFMMKHQFFSVYIIPFCITPIFVRVFMDSRTAFVTHSTMILICAIAVNFQYEFLIVQLMAGMAAVYSLRELSKRSQVLKTALLATIVSIIAYFSLKLLQSNDLLNDNDMYLYLCVNGVLVLLSYPLMWIIEKMFDFNSDVTLFELSDTNRGALRELSEIAPGTFQHSVSVGNLAAEIANKIGADSLLVRTGALYHDIGKMENPAFFTENQAGTNPHDNLTYVDSAQTIISHVTRGISIAERYDLPQFIKDFILTHHATGMTKFFWVKQQNEHPEEDIDASLFTYPGPNPFTREQAILMMADTVEAASRSLKEYTDDTIMKMVHNLIDTQVAEGYFKECPITFRDIAVAKQVMIERLKTIYHTRVSYPELKKR